MGPEDLDQLARLENESDPTGTGGISEMGPTTTSTNPNSTGTLSGGCVMGTTPTITSVPGGASTMGPTTSANPTVTSVAGGASMMGPTSANPRTIVNVKCNSFENCNGSLGDCGGGGVAQSNITASAMGPSTSGSSLQGASSIVSRKQAGVPGVGSGIGEQSGTVNHAVSIATGGYLPTYVRRPPMMTSTPISPIPVVNHQSSLSDSKMIMDSSRIEPSSNASPSSKMDCDRCPGPRISNQAPSSNGGNIVSSKNSCLFLKVYINIAFFRIPISSLYHKEIDFSNFLNSKAIINPSF